jgi:hypothetical protein
LPEHQLIVDRPVIPFAEQSRAGRHVIGFRAAGDVDLDVDPVALTVEVLSAVEILGKDAVDRTSSSPLVRDKADVGAGLIKTKEVKMKIGLISIDL